MKKIITRTVTSRKSAYVEIIADYFRSRYYPKRVFLIYVFEFFYIFFGRFQI